MRDLIGGTQLTTSFQASGVLADQLKLVSKLIKLRNERGGGFNRDIFFVQMGGFDNHSELKKHFVKSLPELNNAVANFW